ncbi:hypothetical protein FHS42_006123 [Streptomyces zagrosensis]|uniref:Uncharacterized protein n=1 Tax=Streptomyces zagrosensis TaxID=1042984 RepID=A0A7W9V282_9ACTN|nr:hypothetical protein [Streptomyces zagrosensis]
MDFVGATHYCGWLLVFGDAGSDERFDGTTPGEPAVPWNAGQIASDAVSGGYEQATEAGRLSPGLSRTKVVSVPTLGWSMEQRAAAKRWLLFICSFTIAGVAFSAFLIMKGNSGGWVLLAISLCIYVGTHLHARYAQRR